MSRKSSQRRIEANRRNAAKSTGPRTPEGKAKASLNATTHGLSGLERNPLHPGCFLKIEDEPAFKGMLDEYVATYCPRHRDELDLLTQAVYAKFRLERVWLAETGQIEIAIARNERELARELPTATATAHLANGFTHSEAMMRLYLRYENQLHRHYLRCLKELRDLQASRLPEPDAPNEPNAPAPVKESASPNEANGAASRPRTAPFLASNSTPALPESEPIEKCDSGDREGDQENGRLERQRCA
jgi:hypothetical protein